MTASMMNGICPGKAEKNVDILGLTRFVLSAFLIGVCSCVVHAFVRSSTHHKTESGGEAKIRDNEGN